MILYDREAESASCNSVETRDALGVEANLPVGTIIQRRGNLLIYLVFRAAKLRANSRQLAGQISERSPRILSASHRVTGDQVRQRKYPICFVDIESPFMIHVVGVQLRDRIHFRALAAKIWPQHLR